MQKIKGINLTDAQADVYRALKTVRFPLADHALVPLAQHALSVHQSSSGIRTRRHELLMKGLVAEAGSVETASGRSAKTYKAV